MSPLMVVDALSTSLTCSLGDVRSYLNNVLRTEHEQTQADAKLTEKYRVDTQKIRQEIDKIRTNTIIFQSSRCSACNQDLELPSVHFMCQHSYHQQYVYILFKFKILLVDLGSLDLFRLWENFTFLKKNSMARFFSIFFNGSLLSLYFNQIHLKKF